MTDLLAPPPRRPMPERLDRRITDELAAATDRRRRPESAIIPLVAAALVGTMVAVGGTAFRDRERVGPAETASPVPATGSPTPVPRPTRSGSGTPTAAPIRVTTLNVRPMTKAEIAADTKSCHQREGADDLVRLGGAPKTRYAMVQRRAGWAGAGSAEVRVLIIEDGASHWSCEDGRRYEAARGEISERSTSATTPVVEVENYGGFSSTCRGGSGDVDSSDLFLVGREVAVGRTRLVGKHHRGPWQTTRPVDGLVAFPFRLDGDAAQERSVDAEFEFLDRDGDRLAIQPYGERGTPTTTTQRMEFVTCATFADMRRRPKPVTRPSSDAAGIRTCQAMTEESAEHQGVQARGNWRSQLVVSTRDEWGTVLSDGRNLVGCSLYPTKEISPFIPDTATVKKSAFFFAVNPVGFSGAQSLWAAGRTPADVSAITYRLPGGQDVAATINAEGYWMLKHHSAAGEDIGPAGNVAEWPPVVVTVTRASGDQRHTITFGEETMCRQVSHGC